MGFNKLKKYLLLGSVIIFSLAFEAVCAEAVKLYIPPIKAKIGQSFEAPVMIDAVENLAGIKLVIAYDDKILKYESAAKTEPTSSLMHVVNDKKSGELIIVMAGAQGIQGKEFPVLNLRFKTEPNLSPDATTSIRITEVQLMSDKLVELKAEVVQNPIVFEP